MPPARSLLVSMAAAGGGRREQHRRGFPALQQIVQLLLLGPRSLRVEKMRKLLFQSLFRRPFTEQAPSSDDAAVTELATALGRTARRRLGRSLSIHMFHAGSCNGGELEIQALNHDYYDVHRFGLPFAASPRHADVLMV